MTQSRLKQIRESEMKSHIEIYTNNELYKDGSWLRKPIKTILDIIPLFDDYSELNVLDLGCGVGRNCIAIAEYFKHIPCKIDCVDILELAIEKLCENAKKFGVDSSINGITQTIEDFCIEANKYDLIIAVSALEHINSEQSFYSKLAEISAGIRKNGMVCLVINSAVTEMDKLTGKPISAQFEVNLPTENIQAALKENFSDFYVVKTTVSEQQYDIPREDLISELNTKVVTFVARKQ